MSWFKKNPVEDCPAFLMRGETIVDVFYLPFRGDPQKDGSRKWIPDGAIEFTATGAADRVIIETPAGCMEMKATIDPESIIRIDSEAGYGTPFVACSRFSMMAISEAEDA